MSGQIKFNSALSDLLDDLVFAVRAAFELPDGEFQEIPAIGHHELRLRVTNQQSHPLMSGNRRLDRHVEELLTKLLKVCPSVRDELDDLLPMLSVGERERPLRSDPGWFHLIAIVLKAQSVHGNKVPKFVFGYLWCST